MRCQYCQSSVQVEGRDETAEFEAVQQAAQMDEAERFEKLRAQAVQPPLLPQSLAHLAVGSVLLPQHVDSAMSEWRQARTELAARGEFPVAERLFHLTRLLSAHLATTGSDEMRRRALLETAMELLQAPRHRQVLRGTLACNAARVGDLEAADAWLAGCNPRSDDIHVDTAWRFSKAYVCTVRGDWNGVMQVLGSRLGDIPIVNSEVEACGVLRAHAVEQLGNPGQATEQLQAMMGQGTRGIAVVEQFLMLNPELGLCPRSFPTAKQRESDTIAERGQALAVGRTGLAGPMVGISIFGTMGLAALAAGLFEKDSIQWGPTALGLFFLMFTSLFVRFGIVENLRRRRLEMRVFESGLDAALTVLAAQEGGKNTSDRVQVIVQIPSRVPYQATCEISGKLLEKLSPGCGLRGRVDSENPAVVLPFA